VQSFDS
jgi:CTD small phosphatase-like protein 2